MASAAHPQEAFLDLVRRPLKPRELLVAGLGGMGAMLAYCVSHELISGFDFSLLPSLFWALAGVLPLILTYELLRRAPDRLILSNPKLALLFLGSSGLAVLLSTFLTFLNEAAFFGEPSDPAQIALARVPLMSGLVAAILVSLRMSRSAIRSSTRMSSAQPLKLFTDGASNGQALPVASKAADQGISLHLQDGLFIPDLSRISSVTAAANYAQLRVGERMILTRVTMAELEAHLASHGFRRIHRSTIVNGAMVESVTPKGKKLAVNLATGERFVVGPSYRDKLLPH